MALAGGPTDVVRRLREAAGDGVLPFDRFVEIALYSPDGFYNAEATPLGPSGSFYTAAHVTPLFGAALARRLQTEAVCLPDGVEFRVVEMGPGDGTLALDVLRSLPTDGLPWRWTFVERSEGLRGRLRERLAREGTGSAAVFDFAETLGDRGPFSGAVIANEFLDALPFRRLVRRGSEWAELGVRWAGDKFEWADGPRPARVPGGPLPAADDGTQYELGERAEGFLREVADHLSDGVAIFLDYGADTDELVRGHGSGTLAAIRDHRVVDPLEAPGTADLSAFVDFGRIRSAAQRAGLVERSFRRQSEALGEWGFAELLETTEHRTVGAEALVQLRLAAKNLLFGFDTFRVLELGTRGPPATS